MPPTLGLPSSQVIQKFLVEAFDVRDSSYAGRPAAAFCRPHTSYLSWRHGIRTQQPSKVEYWVLLIILGDRDRNAMKDRV